MRVINQKSVYLTAVVLIVCSVWGCEKKAWRVRGTTKLASTVDLGQTIGSVAEVSLTESIPVRGYGLAGGLSDTGSAECPLPIRAYLKRYILTQISGQEIDIDGFINSHNTAVVRVEGMMPTTGLKNQTFDVNVTALPGTQTTSLYGGWLYSTELMATLDYAIASRTLAIAKGPVFIDTIDTPVTDKTDGYVLGGGTVLDEYRISITLGDNDYLMISRIRNRLNELYNEAGATAVSPSRIELSVPPKYKAQKQKFVSIIKATYLDQTPEITEERVKTFVRELAVSDNKEASEIALEAIGNQSASKLATLLNSSNEEVQLRAARCMLNMADDRGLKVLVQIAMNRTAYRVEAIEAIAGGAKRNDAVAILQQLLRDSDFDIMLAAYEQLRRLDDVAVTRKFIGRNFYLEQVPQAAYKAIYVFRSGQPRIVLFGAPIYCRDSFLVQSADGGIAIASRRGEKYVSVIREHPTRPVTIGPLRSSFRVGDIIQVLCEEPSREGERDRGGLGVSYAEVIALLKQMCNTGAVRAEFQAGPLPKFD
jgi:flagellar basal body P-ring protein FlgI